MKNVINRKIIAATGCLANGYMVRTQALQNKVDFLSVVQAPVPFEN